MLAGLSVASLFAKLFVCLFSISFLLFSLLSVIFVCQIQAAHQMKEAVSIGRLRMKCFGPYIAPE